MVARVFVMAFARKALALEGAMIAMIVTRVVPVIAMTVAVVAVVLRGCNGRNRHQRGG
jgi:hypothetical protein